MLNSILGGKGQNITTSIKFLDEERATEETVLRHTTISSELHTRNEAANC